MAFAYCRTWNAPNDLGNRASGKQYSGRAGLMSHETYKNAPITEAALDIRVSVPAGINLDVLGGVRDEKYPVSRQRPFKVEFMVGPSGNDPQMQPKGEVSSTPLGFAYDSEDHKQVFQVRTDGFTHNRIAPYIDWRSFSTEARRLWEKYARTAQPETIELLGLNYLNQIFLPLGSPFETYLHAYIEVPAALPQNVNTYNLSFQLSWPKEDGVFAFIGQALGPPLKEGFVTIILNIQAFKRVGKPAREVTNEEIWDTFSTLRDVKNCVFEACISDLVREEIR
jgi:uncharacterized protein (TIGR04255 family)